MAYIRRADIFTPGPTEENPFTPKDLDLIVTNFDRFCPSGKSFDGIHYEPPAFRLPDLPGDCGIGHDPDQSYLRQLLDRTDLPAGGWLTRIWREKDHLYADIDGIPDEVAKDIASGKLKYCSPEINPNFTERGKSYGPAIRRLAFLGAELPKNKDLQPLPKPLYYFSDNKTQVIYCFSEMKVMTREQMIQKLQEWGCDVSMLDNTVPDAVVMGWYSAMKAQMEPDPSLNADLNKPRMFSDEELDKKMVSCSEKVIQRLMPGLLAPLRQDIQGIKTTVDPISNKLQKADQQAKKQDCISFCERMLQAGKITPLEFNGRPKTDKHEAIPSLIERLMALDDTQILNFSDGSKGTKSQLRTEMDAIEARPPLRKFSDTMPQTEGGGGGDFASIRHKQLSATPLGRSILAKEAKEKKTA